MIHTKESAVNNQNDHSTRNGNLTQDHTHKSSTIAAVRFWTEQLKRAILIRYGPVGNNVHVVRQVLHHTKQVVRNKDGMDHVLYKFI
jgi:hypothetical protein